MSAISAGLGALTSILSAVGGVADAVNSFAGLAGKLFDGLKGMIKAPQEQTALKTTDEATQNWAPGQRDYALGQTSNVFSINGAQAPQARAA